MGESTFQGYSCANCGAWVPSGMSHSCTPTGYLPSAQYIPYIDPSVLIRIAAALERIALALEKPERNG